MTRSILILEQARYPEIDLFKTVGWELDVEVVHIDTRLLKYESATNILTPSGRNISEFDAIVFRTYRDAGFLRQVAHIAKNANIPTYGYDPLCAYAFCDKLEDHWMLERVNVNQPKYWRISDSLTSSESDTTFVAKRIWGYGGEDVQLVTRAQASRLPTHEWFCQEYLDALEDWRVYLNAGRAFKWAVRRTAAEGDFRTNRHQGGSDEIFEISEIPGGEEMAALAEEAGHCLRRAYAGVDIRYKSATPLILEVNRTPRIRISPDYSKQLALAWIKSWSAAL